jgi:hypothetical protein
LIGPGSTGWVNSTNAFGGLGGGVRWKNNIPVVPGQKLQVVVASGGGSTGSTSAGNINIFENTDLSSILGLEAGNRLLGTALSQDVGGGFGGVYDITGYNKLNHGGSVGDVNGSDGPSGNLAPCRGFNPITMSYVNRSGGVNMGQNAGGGGSAIPKALNGGRNEVWRGGHGAVRVIWGQGRAYPATKVTDV